MVRDSTNRASRVRSSLLSIAAVILIDHVVYLAVFAPLATKMLGLVTVGPGARAIYFAAND